MKAHEKSDIQSCEAMLAAARALQEGTIIQKLQQIGAQEKLKNKIATKDHIPLQPFSCSSPYSPQGIFKNLLI